MCRKSAIGNVSYTGQILCKLLPRVFVYHLLKGLDIATADGKSRRQLVSAKANKLILAVIKSVYKIHSLDASSRALSEIGGGRRAVHSSVKGDENRGQTVFFCNSRGNNTDYSLLPVVGIKNDDSVILKIVLFLNSLEGNLGTYADTFFDDQHPTLKADFIMANPPFNLDKWGQDRLLDDVRWKFGIPPSGNANFAWVQHMIHHLSPTGKIGLVLANGSLSSQTGGEGDIRRAIIEADLVEGIIALPSQLFYSTGIPVCLWFLSKGKAQPGKTLFIDARNMGTMVTRRLRELTTEGDIKKLAETFEAFQQGTLEDEKGYCAVVTTEDIKAQDYILTPGRYVGIAETEDDGEPFDEKVQRITGELSKLFDRSHELEDEIRKQLGSIGIEF